MVMAVSAAFRPLPALLTARGYFSLSTACRRAPVVLSLSAAPQVSLPGGEAPRSDIYICITFEVRDLLLPTSAAAGAAVAAKPRA